MSGLVVKGALVEYPQTGIPNVIIFQYNPETMTHTWTQPEPAPASKTGAAESNNPLAVKDMPGESFSFTIAMDANDTIADGTPSEAALAQESGIYSRLAALELLLYPTTPTRGSLTGTVSAAIAARLAGKKSGAKSTVPQGVMPVTLFIWGSARIVPVRVTGLTITEKLYDSALNPIHAEAQLTLRVLTPAEMAGALSDKDVQGPLAESAYLYTLGLREQLAAKNLVNGSESTIGMLPPAN